MNHSKNNYTQIIMGLSKVNSSGTWGEASANINSNFDTLATDVSKIKNATTKSKGMFTTLTELKAEISTPYNGDWAYVGDEQQLVVYRYNGSNWIKTDVVTGATMFTATTDTTNYDDVF